MVHLNGVLPIRKIAEDRVALTSYYSKMFVYRSERKANSYADWLLNQITSIGLDKNDDRVTDIKLADTFHNEIDVPRLYSILSTRFSHLTIGSYVLCVDWKDRENFFGADFIRKHAKADMVPIGKSGTSVLLVDKSNILYSTKDGNFNHIEEIGTIEDLAKLPIDKKPIELVELSVFAKPIPLGFVLAARLGLGNLIHQIGVEPRRYTVGERFVTAENEFAIRFKDGVLVFSTDNKQVEFLFGGFLRFHRDTKRYGIREFDRPDVYGTILERNGFGSRFVREIDLMFRMFVDHITRELLVEMHEPTDLVGLLLKASEMLEVDVYPDPMDMAYMRDRGYERFAGAIYNEMVRAIRVYKSRPATAMASIDLNPHAVWQTIMQDPSGMPIQERNPIQNLREKEIVIFGGTGGRNSRSMTETSRMYHESGMGVVSESTSDSSDVATVTYLTADPNYTSVRGTSRRHTPSDGPAKMVSTSMLLSPGSDRDQHKRINFIGIQNAQTIYAEGYITPPLRTGYERVLAYRVDDLFAVMAKQPGKVISIDDKHVRVEYKDGSVQSYELGRRYGKAAGEILPHNLVSNLKLGATFKRGDSICYNSMFFNRDILDPSQVILKTGVLATTALVQSQDTFEDSCAISERICHQLKTMITEVRPIKVAFNQQVRGLIEKGQQVEIESILCTIEDPSEGNSALFDEASLRTLRLLSNKTPKAKMSGIVEKIDIVYNGDIQDMSSTLAALVKANNHERSDFCDKMGTERIDGEVEVGVRVHGDPVDTDTVVILVYITGMVDMSVGDKGVFTNQLKCTVGRVLTGINETESGTPIDALFGYKSLNNRIVNSPMLIGTTNTLLKLLGQRALQAYRS